MTDFICRKCNKPGTEENKLKELDGRLIHARGCEYKKPSDCCNRCGIDFKLVDPTWLKPYLGFVPPVRHGVNNDDVCIYCYLSTGHDVGPVDVTRATKVAPNTTMLPTLKISWADLAGQIIKEKDSSSADSPFGINVSPYIEGGIFISNPMSQDGVITYGTNT